MRVVVDVSTLAVLLVFVLAGVVVAVRQLVVIVGMGVPVGLVVPLARDAAGVLVGDVIVIVAMRRRRVRMVGFPAFTLSALWHCHVFSPDAVVIKPTNAGKSSAAHAMPVAVGNRELTAPDSTAQNSSGAATSCASALCTDSHECLEWSV